MVHPKFWFSSSNDTGKKNFSQKRNGTSLDVSIPLSIFILLSVIYPFLFSRWWRNFQIQKMYYNYLPSCWTCVVFYEHHGGYHSQLLTPIADSAEFLGLWFLHLHLVFWRQVRLVNFPKWITSEVSQYFHCFLYQQHFYNFQYYSSKICSNNSLMS